jgi:hypothetical protein
MRRRVIGHRHPIRAFSDHVSIFYDYGPEGAPLSGTDIFNRKLNGECHVRVVHVIGLRA